MEMIRSELEKSFTCKHAGEIMDHVYLLPGAPENEARQSSTDSEVIRRELAKNFPTERVDEIMSHVRRLPREPKKFARQSGFYEAMSHGVSNHVVWSAADLTNLLAVVPKGSIGSPAVYDAPMPIPLRFRENKVRIVSFSHRSIIDDADIAYLQDNNQMLRILAFMAQDQRQIKWVEKLPNLEHFCIHDIFARLDITSLQCRWSNLVELALFSGGNFLDLSWEIPPVNLRTLLLRNMRRIGGFDWFAQCTNLRFIELMDCEEIGCESIVLPDRVTEATFVTIGNIKRLECGRSAFKNFWASGCAVLESVDLRKSLSVDNIDLCSLRHLSRVEYPSYMPRLDAQTFQSVQNGGSYRWGAGKAKWSKSPWFQAQNVAPESDSDDSDDEWSERTQRVSNSTFVTNDINISTSGFWILKVVVYDVIMTSPLVVYSSVVVVHLELLVHVRWIIICEIIPTSTNYLFDS